MKGPQIIAAKRRAYRELFKGPNAEVVLDDLEKQFNGTGLKKVDGTVDANAVLAAAGNREVLLYIYEQLRKENVVD